MELSYVFLTFYDALVPLNILSLSPLDLSPLEMENLTWTALEGNPLELTHLQELGMDRKFKYV